MGGRHWERSPRWPARAVAGSEALRSPGARTRRRVWRTPPARRRRKPERRTVSLQSLLAANRAPGPLFLVEALHVRDESVEIRFRQIRVRLHRRLRRGVGLL